MFSIKNISNETIHISKNADNIYSALEDAVSLGKNLKYADLQGADLRYANLKYADLRYANLKYADLQGAKLQGAKLQYAKLRYADLQGANLQCAKLRYAKLRYANLQGADLQYADLSGATGLTENSFGIEVDTSLPKKIAEIVLADTNLLKMDSWHTCKTTHCLAGWAIHLSGPAGYALEKATSPSVAGAMLLPSGAPLFLASNEEAVEWLKKQL